MSNESTATEKPLYKIPCVSLLPFRGGEVLVLRKTATGLLEFPGGKQEGYESTRDCATRELREETGLELRDSPIQLLGIWENDITTRDDLPPYLCQFYLTRIQGGQKAIIGEPDKFDGVEWIKPCLLDGPVLQGSAFAALNMLLQQHPHLF